MKKFLWVLFIGIGYGSLQANSRARNTIECPPGLDFFDNTIKNRHGLLLQKYKSQNENNLTYITLDANLFFNGYPFPVSGWIHFQPSVSSKIVSAYMHNTMQFKPPHVSFSQGIARCTYKYGVDKENDGASLLVTLDTKNAGVFYQCPLPEDITVEEQREMQLVKVVSLPSCNGKFKGSCSDYKRTLYVDRDRIIPNKTDATLYNVEGPRRGLIVDPTASTKVPMKYVKIAYKGSDKVYTYKFVGKYGPLSLASEAVDKDVEKGGLINITTPERSSFINRGFGQDAQRRAITDEGELVVPPCKATQIVKNKDELKIRCVYGSDSNPEKTIILESIQNLHLDMNMKKCFVWGERYKGGLLEKFLASGSTATLWSIRKDGTHIPPAVIFCAK